MPLEVYVSKFSHMRFEPSGLTNDEDIRVAKSIVDYIFRWMGKKFLTTDQREECARCGGRMIRTGSCYTCRDCGTNSGCS